MTALKVVGSIRIYFLRGYGAEIPSQVTKVSLRGVTGWVRENRRASSLESFMLSSNARLGHKADGNRIGREVLELAAPKEVWDDIASAVATMDELGRPVLRNARWTVNTASYYWERHD